MEEPRFLNDPPASAPPVERLVPVRQVDDPYRPLVKILTPMRARPEPDPPPPPVRVAHGWLDRVLAPDRMPWPMRHAPRISGAVMIAIGVWAFHKLVEIAARGDVYHRKWERSLKLVAPEMLLLGAWLAITGRPHDEDGYAPRWWNAGYAVACALGVVCAVILCQMYF
jgi:hypothetical protein